MSKEECFVCGIELYEANDKEKGYHSTCRFEAMKIKREARDRDRLRFEGWIKANLIHGYEPEDAYANALRMEEIFKREGRIL
jgi:hypothetical protein